MDRLVFSTLCLFVFSIPIENMLVIPGFGALGRVAGMLAFAVGLAGLLVIRRSWRSHPMIWLMAVFVIWGGMTFYWSIDPVSTLHRSWTYLQLLVMMWLVLQWVNDEKDIANLLTAYVCGAYVSVFATIGEYLFTDLGMADRYAAKGFNPNDLAVIMALGIPMAWHLFQTGSLRRSWMFGIYPPIAAIAILLTASRNGLIALSVSFVFILLTLGWQARRARWLVPLLGLGLLLWLSLYLPATTVKRLATLPAEVGGANTRFQIWGAALTIFNDNPLLGIGAGAFKAGAEQLLGIWIAPHNVYLAILVEGGVVGFVIFLAILFIAIYSACSLARRARLLWMNVLLVWGISAGALNWEWRKQTWLILILAAAHAACTAECDQADRVHDVTGPQPASHESLATHGH